jgi:transcriptional regulator with XRE-family HTH domain
MIRGMGRAGQALKQVLEAYEISQNQLAVPMGIRRSNISRWVAEIRDPVAETFLDLRDALHRLNPAAAEEFVRLYLGEPNQEREQSSEGED